MDDQDKLELKRLVASDKKNIREFLRVHNVHLYKPTVSCLFKESELFNNNPNVTILKDFKNLWEIDGEPEKVKIEFKIDLGVKKELRRFLDCQENLVNKIVDRAWPDNPVNSQDYLDVSNKVCQHPRQVNLVLKEKFAKVTIIATLCYCS